MKTRLRRTVLIAAVTASLLGLSAVAAPAVPSGTTPIEDDSFARTFAVQAYSNQIQGWSWVDGPVTVEVWDAGFGNLLRSQSVTPDAAGDFNLDFGQPGQPGTFELTTHQRFVVYDGVTTKVLTATDLEVTGISYPGNYAVGAGAAVGDVTVSVGTEWPTTQPIGTGVFAVTPDGAGDWTMDFGSYGLTAKPAAFHFAVQHTDANGDNYAAEVFDVFDYPHLEVDTCGSAAPECAGWIAQAVGYDPGVELHLDVTFPDSSTFSADQTTDGSGQVSFDVSPMRFVAGTLLTLTGPTPAPFLDGFGNRQLLITDQGITNVDLANGTVSGFARDGANILVEPSDQPPGAWVRRHTATDAGQVNFPTQSFAVPGDEPWGEDTTTTLTPAGSVEVRAYDEPDYDVQSVRRPNVVQAYTFLVSPTTGLFDGQDVWVHGTGFTPNAEVGIVQCVPDTDPPRCNPFVTLTTGGQGEFSGPVQVARDVDGFDAASAPGATNLVAFDFSDPWHNNVAVPLSFARLDLYDAEADGHGGWTQGDALTGPVAHGESVWVEGVGFPPPAVELDLCAGYGSPQAPQILCRNNTQWVWPDASGSFHGVLRMGQNVFAPHGVRPSMTVTPYHDLRDGQTVTVDVTGLPVLRGIPTFDSMASRTGPFVAAFVGGGNGAPVVSQPVKFSGSAPTVHVLVNQAIAQPNPTAVGGEHVEGLGTPREVTWNTGAGTLEYPYTAIQRWTAEAGHQPFDPPPVENGYYDFADTLVPVGGVATGPIRSDMALVITEGPNPPGVDNVVSFIHRPLQFARFDLGGATTGGVLTSKPKGVTLSGFVTCTGFMPEQYVVSIRGTLEQTTGSGRRSTTTRATFTTSVTCSGTMANPGTAYWTANVPTTFQSGTARATLELSSAGFTRAGGPLVVLNTVTLTAPRAR